MNLFVDLLDVPGYLNLRWSKALPEQTRPRGSNSAQHRQRRHEEQLFRRDLYQSRVHSSSHKRSHES